MKLIILKKFVLYTFLYFLSNFTFSQDNYLESDNVIPYRAGNEWGYADIRSGEILIEPIYSSINELKFEKGKYYLNKVESTDLKNEYQLRIPLIYNDKGDVGLAYYGNIGKVDELFKGELIPVKYNEISYAYDYYGFPSNDRKGYLTYISPRNNVNKKSGLGFYTLEGNQILADEFEDITVYKNFLFAKSELPFKSVIYDMNEKKYLNDTKYNFILNVRLNDLEKLNSKPINTKLPILIENEKQEYFIFNDENKLEKINYHQNNYYPSPKEPTGTYGYTDTIFENFENFPSFYPIYTVSSDKEYAIKPDYKVKLQDVYFNIGDQKYQQVRNGSSKKFGLVKTGTKKKLQAVLLPEFTYIQKYGPFLLVEDMNRNLGLINIVNDKAEEVLPLENRLILFHKDLGFYQYETYSKLEGLVLIDKNMNEIKVIPAVYKNIDLVVILDLQTFVFKLTLEDGSHFYMRNDGHQFYEN